MKSKSYTVTSDIIHVSDNQISCNVNSIITSGISCFRQVKHLADELGLKMGNDSPNDKYKFLLDEYRESDLYIYVNLTDVIIEPALQSYVWCKQLTVKDDLKQTDEKAILKRKYFASMSNIYGKLVDSLSVDLDILHSTANFLISNGKEKYSAVINKETACFRLNTIWWADCTSLTVISGRFI